jgi:hypothetical protein
MSNANATRAATRPNEAPHACPLSDAIDQETAGADSSALLICVAAPSDELIVYLAYLHGELTYRFFRMVEKFMGALHG